MSPRAKSHASNTQTTQLKKLKKKEDAPLRTAWVRESFTQVAGTRHAPFVLLLTIPRSVPPLASRTHACLYSLSLVGGGAVRRGKTDLRYQPVPPFPRVVPCPPSRSSVFQRTLCVHSYRTTATTTRNAVLAMRALREGL
uniref:Uncharacterized protein n=1 Tax=Caenorhabditis japonica TaxID=281687 RepID=A0A8R1ISP5_CAEJA